MENKTNEWDELGETDIFSFRNLFQRLISEKNKQQLENLLKQEKVRKLIFDNAWDIVPDLCKAFSDKRERRHRDLLQPIENLLVSLAETCASKDLLVLLVEQLQENNYALFKALLCPVQKCLLHVTMNRGHSLAFVLKSFYDQIRRLPLPKEQNLEGKERLLLDLDENLQRIVAVVPCFVDFLSPFVSEQAWKIETGKNSKNRSGKQIKDLTFCLVQILNHPLAHLDLKHDVTMISNPAAKSDSRFWAETVLELLKKLHPDLVKTIVEILAENEKFEVKKLRNMSVDAADVTEEVQITPLLGLSTLTYLVFSENLCVNWIPRVYTHQFLLELNFPFLLCLLQRPELLLIEKGLSLAGSLLQRLPPKEWALTVLENSNLRELMKSLVFVASSVKSKELGEFALRLLLTIMKVFDTDGRVKLLHYLLTIAPHVKVAGYVITMLVNEISEALDSNSSDFFSPATEKLLMLVFALPKGEKTDLLDHSERIMGALNLLRFLLLRDGVRQNVTGIWNLIPLIENKYFQVLGNGIALSRAHYQLELRKVQDMKAADVKQGDNATAGRSLTKQEQIRVMKMAINTFDMMEGILGNVTELLQRKKKEATEENESCESKE